MEEIGRLTLLQKKKIVAKKSIFFFLPLYLLVLESPDYLVRRKEGCSLSVIQVLLCYVLRIVEVLA